LRLTEINIYPVKSLAGISLETARVEDRGLALDRRWMLVDAARTVITQREVPAMATVRLTVNGQGIVAAMNGDSIDIPGEPAGDEAGRVKVWGSSVKAAFYDAEVDRWFTERLGVECRLVRMMEWSKRAVNPIYAVRKFDDEVSFADGYPFMMIGRSSLDDLNSRLSEPLPMNRFRPNFVVSGAEPFAEDGWKKIRIGETVFHIVKPCERCAITTVDQEKGEKDGPEPLKTLNSYRNRKGKLLFGQNLIAEKAGGKVSVGDEVEVMEPKRQSKK
jgi:uncharacterized protein YcbX